VSIASMIANHGQTISIQTKGSGSTDSSGGIIEAWSSATNSTAFVQVRAGGEAIEGGGERYAPTATIYIEGVSSIGIKDRIAYDSRTWSVSSVRTPDERSTGDSLAYTIVEATEVFG